MGNHTKPGFGNEKTMLTQGFHGRARRRGREAGAKFRHAFRDSLTTVPNGVAAP